MQGIYNNIPETNNIYGIYCCSFSVFTIGDTCNVISTVKYVLFFYINTLRSVCVCAVFNVAVFFSSLISRFPGILRR